MTTTPDYGVLHVPRSRGALSGVLLVLLGAWGALIAFIGPYFDYSYRSDATWDWTSQRGWLEVLPGVVTMVGGLVLLRSGTRIGASLGAWLGVAGSVGQPTASSEGGRAAAELGYFSLLGAAIILVAGFALGRLSIVAARDVRGAERSEPEALAEPGPSVTRPAGGDRELDERYEREGVVTPTEGQTAESRAAS